MTPEEGYQEALRRIEQARRVSAIELDLRSLQLMQIPFELTTCLNLQKLDLMKNQINKLSNLPVTLMTLNIGLNQISKLENIPQGLQTLYSRGNKISVIENLPQCLQVLDLSNNQVSRLGNLPDCLKTLDLNENQISRLENLPDSLQLLYLAENQVSVLENLPQNVQTLNLNYNNIRIIGNLPDRLQNLELTRNQIYKIENLPPGLQQINLTGNQICQLENLPVGLQRLDLSLNQIRHLVNLPDSLLTLDLSENQIEELENLPHSLTRLRFFRNPTTNIPTELLGDHWENNCLSDVRAWFADLKRESRPNRTIKFMVSGNSDVGKSSLLEALRLGKAQPGQDSTHGIRIEALPLTDRIQQIDGISFDFGGQEIYHGTHQLFLRSRAVQVVVFDAQTEAMDTSPDRRGKQGELNRNKPLAQWLDDLRRRSPDSQFVLVQNKIDSSTPLPPNTQALVHEIESGQECAVVRVSAYTGRGIMALKGHLTEAAQNLPECGMLMPASWVAVRNYFLENSRKPVADRQRIVSRDFFDQLCTERNVLPNSEAALRRYLHNTGVVYYDETYLQKTIIADQQWVIEAIYEVLDRRGQLYDELKIGYGKKQLTYLFRYFNQEYTPNERRLFVAMMESCGLCFPLREEPYGPVNDDTYYLFPNFLPDEQPDSVRYFLANPSGKIVYRQTVPFLPYYHVQQLIVRWGAKTRQENLWRSGFLVTLPQKGGFVLEADFTANTLTLTAEPTVSTDTITGLLQELSCENAGWQAIGSAPSLVRETRVVSPSGQFIRETLPDVVQTKIRKLVVSYAREDVRYVDLLRKKMAARKTVELWYDRNIDGWSDWDGQIKQQFTDCDGYVIFLSDTYMDAETKAYIHKKEIPLMLQRFKADQAYVSVIHVTTYNTEYTNIASFLAFRKAALMPDPDRQPAEASQFLESFINEKLFGDFLTPGIN